MAKLARALPRFDGGLAEAFAAWSDDVAITVVTAVENGNMSAGSVVITNATSATPTIEIDRRAGAGAAWRHFMFAVENAAGKTPTFKVNRATRDAASVITANWKPVYTTDFITWVQADSVVLTGGTSGTIDFTFPGGLPSGTVYISSSPTGRQADATAYKNYLLSTYPSYVTPTASANASGVYATSPAENDDISRAVGSNEQYALKLAFGGSTNDGKRKRKMVVLAGIHAAGEQQCWTAFKAAINWLMSSSDSQAIALRANWDFYLYFLLNPNGVRGGNYRGVFRNSTDPNRDWKLTDPSVLQEINDVRSAIVTDTGGAADFLMSWHGDVNQSVDFRIWVNPTDFNAGTRSAAFQAIIDEGTPIFGMGPNYVTSSTSNTDVWWGPAKLGCKTAVDSEIVAASYTTDAWYTGIAQKWMKTIAAVDALGHFISPAELDGAANAVSTATGALTTEILLTGAAVTLATANAVLTTSIDLAGVAVNVASATGDLGGSIALAGSATSEAAASSALTTQITLSGDAIAQAIASAGIDTSILLAGSASSQASATGDLSGAAALQGGATAQATSSATLTAQIRLAGDAIAQALASGSLDASALLSGNATGQASATGELTTGIPLAGEATATITGAGDLSTEIKLAGVSVAQASATGELLVNLTLAGDAVAVVLAGATLTTQIPLAGVAQAVAAGTGLLTGVAIDAPAGSGYRPGRVVKTRPSYTARSRPGSH